MVRRNNQEIINLNYLETILLFTFIICHICIACLDQLSLAFVAKLLIPREFKQKIRERRYFVVWGSLDDSLFRQLVSGLMWLGVQSMLRQMRLGWGYVMNYICIYITSCLHYFKYSVSVTLSGKQFMIFLCHQFTVECESDVSMDSKDSTTSTVIHHTR